MLDNSKRFSKIKRLRPATTGHIHRTSFIFAASLLVHAATIDSEFDALERDRIEWLCENDST